MAGHLSEDWLVFQVREWRGRLSEDWLVFQVREWRGRLSEDWYPEMFSAFIDQFSMTFDKFTARMDHAIRVDPETKSLVDQGLFRIQHKKSKDEAATA